jgi:octopine/nopaline transport system substrate-binding protein
MAAMSITPKRMDVIAFSVPYSSAPTTFAVMKNGPLATLPDEGVRINLEDKAATDAAMAKLKPLLKGKVIGVQISTIQADLLNAYFKDVAEIRTYKTTEEHDLDLQAGRVDAVVSSTSYFVSTLTKPGGEKVKLTGPLLSGGMLGKGAGIGLRKGDPELKALFDTAIKAAIADGTVKTLTVKWFKTDLTPQ